MDKCQYSTLLEVLQDIPEPRKARGQRYVWALVLTLIGALWPAVNGRHTPWPTG
jgi:hypothetical protein